jgi:uncharacterized protein YidB (DUF937 family)
VKTRPRPARSLEKAAGADTLDALARETGMPRDEVLRRLTAELPQDVDKLTPRGRIPAADEASI